MSAGSAPLTEESFQRGNKNRALDELRREYIQEKGFTFIKKWECEWWILDKTDNNVKQHIRENFPYRRLLAEYQSNILESGKLFGYVQRDIEVPKHLKQRFANFPPLFENTFFDRKDMS